MKPYILLLFFSACFTDLFAQQADTLKKKTYDFRYFKKGLVEQSKGNYTLAILDFTIFIDDHKEMPPYAKAFYHRANSYRYIKDFKKAITDFEKLHEIRNDADGALGVGQCYTALFDHTKAIDWFKKGLERAPMSPILHNEIGMQLCATNDFSAGVRAFHKAIKYDSTFAMAYNNIGAATYFDQDVDSPERADVMQAKSWFDQALRYDTTLSLAWKNRGAVLFFLKNYTAAKDDLQHALRQNSLDAYSHLYLGITEAALGNTTDGFAELQEAVRINPHLETGYEELGHLAKQLHNYPKTLEYYEQALRAVSPKAKQYQGLIWFYKALIYAELADEKNTKTALQKANKLGVFSERTVYTKFVNAPILKQFKETSWLKKIHENLLSIDKDSKFLNTQLKWFKMREGAAKKIGG